MVSMKMEIRGPITITKQFRQLQNIYFFFFSQNTSSLTKTEIPSFRKFWVKNGSYDNSKRRSHSQIEISLFAWKAMWTQVWSGRRGFTEPRGRERNCFSYTYS